ncbi:MAG: hypothetical protein LBT46_14450 [Planctomycetaceae bacterium]|jgi:hypothetical protein|nr:hypothetical protein [Planctomycetaceae bacterium]
MSVKHNSEPTVTETSPAPSSSTDTFEEWNFQDENVSGNHTVLDGKIIARMPDLGAAPSISQINDDDEPSVAELFRKAFAAALRGKKKKIPAASERQLYRRLSAAGIAVLICGAGLLFLEKSESAKDVSASTAAIEESSVLAAETAVAAKTASEVPVIVAPDADVFASAGAAGTNYPPKNPFERISAADDSAKGTAAIIPSTVPNTDSAGVPMYSIPSQDNIAASNIAANNTAAPAVYPAANYQANYPVNSVNTGNAATAYYPAQDRLNNHPASAYPVAAIASAQNENTVPAGYNAERQPYNAPPQYPAGYNNTPNNAGYPSYAAPQTQGSYLQSAGRTVTPTYPPPQGYQQQGNPYPNGVNNQTHVPIPESSLYPPPMPQQQYQPVPYQQQVPYQQTPQVSQPNYPYDYPSHRKVY